MIVPRNKLLLWFALIVLPFAALGSIFRPTATLSLGVIILFLVSVLIDVLISRPLLNGISVNFPAVVRFTRGKKGLIEFQIRNATAKEMAVRIGLAFPLEFLAEDEELTLNLPGNDTALYYGWPCMPRERGNYHFAACYLETVSLIGLWAIRKTLAVQMEAHVYPDLARERKTLAALFLNRGIFGIHAQRQLGQGREFEKLREYVYGDSYDSIHWKATARHGRPVTKVYQIEKTQEVYVIIDSSRLSGRAAADSDISSGTIAGKPDKTILERFIKAALIMGLAAQKQGDLFGLMSFDDRVRNFVKAKNGKEHFNICRNSLYNLQPQTVNPDFDDLFTFIGQRLRRRALLIFLTCLDDMVLAENFVRNMEMIERRHLVLVNMIKPAGAVGLFNRPDINRIDDIYQDLGGHIVLHNLLELQQSLRLRGINFALPDNEKLCTEIVSQYVSIKNRQLI